MHQLLSAVCWLYEEHNIVHRDLKPEVRLLLCSIQRAPLTLSPPTTDPLQNILVKHRHFSKGVPEIKIIDFGLARVQEHEEERFRTRCGTIGFVLSATPTNIRRVRLRLRLRCGYYYP